MLEQRRSPPRRSYKMIIENAVWQNDTKTVIGCTIDGAPVSVPVDTANREYQAILEWVAEGNTIAEP